MLNNDIKVVIVLKNKHNKNKQQTVSLLYSYRSARMVKQNQ